MNNLSGAARRMTRNLDQFSVICVFGSVVGCVVLPFMIQSVESFIITFLLLCLTAKPLRGKLFPAGNQAQQESERRRSKDKDDNKKSKKSTTKKKPVQVVGSSEQMQRVREEDLLKQEQQRLEDRERRLEEKREKKARKKEERLQRKEEEKREKEKEDQLRRERQEARMQKKKEEKERKQKAASFDIPTHENIQSIVNGMKPLRRERKHSTSSSASAGSVSAHSTPPRFQQHSSRYGTNSRRHAAPFRASSDPELSVTARTSPTPSGKHWQATSTSNTLPTPGSSNWYTDIANRAFPSLPVVTTSTVGPQPLFYPQGSYVGVYPTTTSFQQSMSTQNSTCWSVPPTMCVRNHDPSHVGEPLQYYVPQAAWLPVSGSNQLQGGSVRNFSPAPGAGTGTGNGNAQQPNRFMEGQLSGNHSSTAMYNQSLLTSGFSTRNTGGIGHGNGSNCYSLFSSGGASNTTPFSAVGGFLNLDTSMDHMQYQAVSTGSPLSVNSDLSDGQNSLEAEPCGEGFQSSHHCLVESIGSSLPGQGGEGGKQPSCEWPNI